MFRIALAVRESAIRAIVAALVCLALATFVIWYGGIRLTADSPLTWHSRGRIEVLDRGPSLGSSGYRAIVAASVRAGAGLTGVVVLQVVVASLAAIRLLTVGRGTGRDRRQCRRRLAVRPQPRSDALARLHFTRLALYLDFDRDRRRDSRHLVEADLGPPVRCLLLRASGRHAQCDRLSAGTDHRGLMVAEMENRPQRSLDWPSDNPGGHYMSPRHASAGQRIYLDRDNRTGASRPRYCRARDFQESWLPMPAGSGQERGIRPDSGLAYAIAHPRETIHLAMLRIVAVLGHVRPYYTPRHNLALLGLLVPLYCLAVLGLIGARREPLAAVLASIIGRTLRWSR